MPHTKVLAFSSSSLCELTLPWLNMENAARKFFNTIWDADPNKTVREVTELYRAAQCDAVERGDKATARRLSDEALNDWLMTLAFMMRGPSPRPGEEVTWKQNFFRPAPPAWLSRPCRSASASRGRTSRRIAPPAEC